MAELNYTAQDIFNQQFRYKMRGYDPEEVDEYLDNIIRDYEEYERENLELQEENIKLKAKLANASKVQQKVVPVTDSSKHSVVTNLDILKRLSNLEREVFGKKVSSKPKTESTEKIKLTKFEEPEIDEQATRRI